MIEPFHRLGWAFEGAVLKIPLPPFSKGKKEGHNGSKAAVKCRRVGGA
jgi:hypothetical protein